MLSAIESRLGGSRVDLYARDALRVAQNLGRYRARVTEAWRLTAEVPTDVAIDPAQGYWMGTVDDIPGLTPVFDQVRRFAQDRRSGLDAGVVMAEAEARHIRVKPFYFNVLGRKEVQRIPEILDFATSDGILAILCKYYRVLPELSHVAVFVSGFLDQKVPPDAAAWQPQGTQQWHWDRNDLRHVKLFVLLDDVGPDDGPLRFLPAPESRTLARMTRRRFRTRPFKRDEELAGALNADQVISIVGSAGTAALLDTSRCLHQGSRCRAGHDRVTFVLHYLRHAEYRTGVSKDYSDLNRATAPELRPDYPAGSRRGLAWRILPNAAG